MDDSVRVSFVTDDRTLLATSTVDVLADETQGKSLSEDNVGSVNSNGRASPDYTKTSLSGAPLFPLPLLTSTARSSPASPNTRLSASTADSLGIPPEYSFSHGPIPADRSPPDRAVSPLNPVSGTSPTNSSVTGTSTVVNSIPVRRPRHKPGERRELLTRAVEDVLKLNISMRRAAQKYNLAKSSLCDFVRKNKISLPNLRFKPNASEMGNSSLPRVGAAGFKRVCSDDIESAGNRSSPCKVACGIGRKHTFFHAEPALLDTSSLSLNASDDCDTGYEHLVSSGFCDSTTCNSVDSWSHSDPHETSPGSTDIAHCQPRCTPHSGPNIVTNRNSTFLSFSKPSRIESPWHNSAGLPTQVPLRSWSAHNAQSLTAAALSSISGSLDRKLSFNSLQQLRQTIESHSLISDTNSPHLIPHSSVGHTSGVIGDNNSQSSLVGRVNEVASHSGDISAAKGYSLLLESFGRRTTPVGSTPITEPHALPDRLTLPKCSFTTSERVSAENSLDTSRDPTSDALTSSYCSNVDPNISTGFPSTTLTADLSSLPPSSYPTSPTLSCDNGFNTIAGQHDNNSFFGASSVRLPFSSPDPRLNVCSQPNLISSADGSISNPLSVTKPNVNSCVAPNLQMPPCSSIASILSTDFSSLHQTALATLLFQHSRNVAPTSSPVPHLSNLVGYPTNLSHSVSTGGGVGQAPSLLPTDFISTQPTTPAYSPLGTTCLSVGQSQTPPTIASIWNNLTGGISATDLLRHFGLDELQQFVYRQPTPRLSNDLNSSSTALATALAAQLLPHLSNQSFSQSFRPLLTGLLASLSQKAQDPLCTASRSTNSNSLTPGFNSSENPKLTVEKPTTVTDQQTLSSHNTSTKMSKLTPCTRGLMEFIDKSPSPFHAVQTACGILTSSGFRELNESEPWKLKPMDCIFVKKNGSTLLAAAVGGKFKPGNGFHLIGAHTDSPCLRLKPVSERTKEGYVQLGVETYGGGLWYTWFDRELKVAGRVVLANSAGRLEEHLVNIDRPLACIPSLAIHLNREVKVQGFNPNSEQHLLPILCTSLMDQLATTGGESTADPTPPVLDVSQASTSTTTATCAKHRHPAGLLRAIADHLGIPEPEEPLELELYLADFQPARVGGLHNEFIHAPRLDNLFNSYTSLSGLVDSLESLAEDTCLRVVCLYDHEEIGSTSTQGANSCHTKNILRRITNALASSKYAVQGLPDNEDPVIISESHFEESLSKSFLLSADQSHAVHPSYHDRHEVNHRPQFHSGIVLKCNTNQRYATNALTAAAVRQIARFANVPVQEFTNRQDVQCGSTIGPLLSAQLGVPTADVGFAQLAMHSCRELCCTTSVGQAVRFYSAFFKHMPRVWPPC